MGGEWMMGKFGSLTATASALRLLVLTILLGAQGFAQTAPAEQTQAPAAPASAAQPPSAPDQAAQQPASGQEASAEESTTAHRKARPHDYKNWEFNVGGGANLDSGATQMWVRGGGIVGSAGVARNGNKYLGLRADLIFADLPLRDSTEQLAQATGSRNYALAVTLEPIINVPVTEVWGGYVFLGPAYYHRAGSLSGSTTVPGSACNTFWNWWGACQNYNFALPISGSFANSSLNEFGFDAGGGLTRKMPSGVEVYAEWRIMHGSHNGITTDFRPITIGFRW
jgi:Outer membrane protein beta-barrel domain